jgi:competence protein ComEC
LLVVPGCPDDSPTATSFERATEEESVEPVVARAGDRFEVADLRLDVIAPDRCWSGTNSDPNNDSVVLMATVGDRRVLLAGDAERESQAAMLAADVDLHADVLKVPHHGGNTSLDAFLAASGAAVAIVSVGQPNDYGHPVASVLATIAATGARVVRTDRSGTVTVSLPVSGPVVLSGA